MGDYMALSSSNAAIADVPGAWEALKALALANGPGAWSWVDPHRVATAVSFEDAMMEWRWGVFPLPNGSLNIDEFRGERCGDDLLLFQTIAPFVKVGGYIEMFGVDDGERWRWVFDGKTCQEHRAEIKWPELPAEEP